jgi:hypothetical protein
MVFSARNLPSIQFLHLQLSGGKANPCPLNKENSHNIFMCSDLELVPLSSIVANWAEENKQLNTAIWKTSDFWSV